VAVFSESFQKPFFPTARFVHVLCMFVNSR